MSIITCRSHLSQVSSEHSKGQATENLVHYIGGNSGTWRITNAVTHSGEALKPATHVEIVNGRLTRLPAKSAWALRAVVSTTRYITREEPRHSESLRSAWQNTDSSSAALLLGRKSAAWRSLDQVQRREMLEARSKQIATRLRFLPAIARRLCFRRDLGDPFDFVVWFEFCARDTAVFDDLVAAMRSSEEWLYVEREIDIRLTRD